MMEMISIACVLGTTHLSTVSEVNSVVLVAELLDKCEVVATYSFAGSKLNGLSMVNGIASLTATSIHIIQRTDFGIFLNTNRTKIQTAIKMLAVMLMFKIPVNTSLIFKISSILSYPINLSYLTLMLLTILLSCDLDMSSSAIVLTFGVIFYLFL